MSLILTSEENLILLEHGYTNNRLKLSQEKSRSKNITNKNS